MTMVWMHETAQLGGFIMSKCSNSLKLIQERTQRARVVIDVLSHRAINLDSRHSPSYRNNGDNNDNYSDIFCFSFKLGLIDFHMKI